MNIPEIIAKKNKKKDILLDTDTFNSIDILFNKQWKDQKKKIGLKLK